MLSLGERLRLARENKGLSLQQLADLIGLKQRTTLFLIESGKQKTLPTGKLQVLSEVLGVTKEFLLGFEDFEGNPLDAAGNRIENISRIQEEIKNKIQEELKEELKEELLKEMIDLKKREENADKWQINMRNALVELSEDEQNEIGKKLYEIALMLKNKK